MLKNGETYFKNLAINVKQYLCMLHDRSTITHAYVGMDYCQKSCEVNCTLGVHIKHVFFFFFFIETERELKRVKDTKFFSKVGSFYLRKNVKRRRTIGRSLHVPCFYYILILFVAKEMSENISISENIYYFHV